MWCITSVLTQQHRKRIDSTKVVCLIYTHDVLWSLSHLPAMHLPLVGVGKGPYRIPYLTWDLSNTIKDNLKGNVEAKKKKKTKVKSN